MTFRMKVMLLGYVNSSMFSNQAFHCMCIMLWDLAPQISDIKFLFWNRI